MPNPVILLRQTPTPQLCFRYASNKEPESVEEDRAK